MIDSYFNYLNVNIYWTGTDKRTFIYDSLCCNYIFNQCFFFNYVKNIAIAIYAKNLIILA